MEGLIIPAVRLSITIVMQLVQLAAIVAFHGGRVLVLAMAAALRRW